MASEVPPGLLLVFAAAFGAIWGSFFNVAIYRWPREMSVVRPASRCPGCGAPVQARYNLPILGYVLLRGKTACCGAKLSVRYPIVEALSGVLALAVAQRFILGAAPDTSLLRAAGIACLYFAFVGGLLIATFVDLEHMEIPDEVSLPGAALGLASAVLRDPSSIADVALGAGGGYLLVQLVFVWSYEHLTGRRGMGEGDSKLLMMIGAFLGYQGVLFALFAGAAQGLVGFVVARSTGATLETEPPVDAAHSGEADVALGPSQPAPPPATAANRLEAGRSDEPLEHDDAPEDDGEPDPKYWGHLKLPFGPFLALGALEYLFFGPQLIELWFDLTASFLASTS